MSKAIQLFASLALLCCLSGLAMTQEKPPKVNKYYAPTYPNWGVYVGLKGEIQVKVKIDRKGDVISSEAGDGPAPLRRMAGEAASKWGFSTSKTEDVRSAILVFVFSIKKNNKGKYNYKKPTFQTKFKKPYRLELIITEYLRVNAY